MTDHTHVPPQWQPPTQYRDPLVRRMFIDRATWMRAQRGLIPKLHDRAVAMAFATYGNKDGSRNFPGAQTLADDLCLSVSTVKRALMWLAENGWITRTQRGNRWDGKADEWQLSLPAPLAASLGRWTTSAGEQWMERPKDEPKRPGLRDRPAPLRQGRQGIPTQRDRCPEEAIGVCKDGDRSPSLDPPPEGHQNPLHHSDLPDRPHAVARGAIADLDDEDEMLAAIETEVGGPLRPDVEAMVNGMLSRGADPRMVLRVAIARERNPA